MADSTRVAAEPETPVNPYSLLEAVNSASDTANTSWLIFLGLMAYLLIAVAGVSHRDLLLETPVALPFMQVAVQQALFFEFAPVLLVLFHFGIVSQLVMLARKTLEFDFAVRALEFTERRTHPLRLELHNFFFVQAVAGPHRSKVMSGFLHAMSWLTLVVIPIAILLFIQISYVPFHDITTTWLHRICLLADIVMLVLIGVFLMRSESNFFSAFWRSTVTHPVSFLATLTLLVAVLFFSFFVATIPGEPLDRVSRSMSGGPRETNAGAVNAREAEAGDRRAAGYAVPFISARLDGSLWSKFNRNLVVTDTDLVRGTGSAGDDISISLRNRDLRFARLDRSNLARADLTGARLEGASLAGADLTRARLQCADLDALVFSEDRTRARCVDARNASFLRAKLPEANLSGIDLSGARLDEARLDGAELHYAVAIGASFVNARLDKADLTGGVQLQGANLLVASLQGADAAGANLQGADLASASLVGVNLSNADLAGATLRDTDLEAADLQYARLVGVEMSGAKIRAADLRGAIVWSARPPSRDAIALADLGGMAVRPAAEAETTSLREAIARIGDSRVRTLVQEAVAPALGSAGEAWTTSSDQAAWRALVTVTGNVATQETYAKDLTDHLSTLICKVRFSDASAATGVARRAMQGSQFRGIPAAVFDRLRAKDCPASDTISKPLLQRLSAVIDGAAGR